MNDVMSQKVLCPFYEAHNHGSGNKITITCEKIRENMGFDIRNQLLFADNAQRKDYMEIFCMDRYKGCPYYRAIYNQKYKES